MKKILILLFCSLACSLPAAGTRPLRDLQQDFVDTRFGMFIHFNIPTRRLNSSTRRRSIAGSGPGRPARPE